MCAHGLAQTVARYKHRYKHRYKYRCQARVTTLFTTSPLTYDTVPSIVLSNHVFAHREAKFSLSFEAKYH
jgi:hypothetical protein